MKFGLLYNKKTTNLGDDIQAYAAERLLPRVDYLVHREALDMFDKEAKEPVAIVMAAWFMTRKWQWPPAANIVPKFVGFHYTNFLKYRKKYHQIGYDYISGPGADYLKAYGPIGCRDLFTMEQLRQRGIDAYFSGCITLTLPPMPKMENDKEYICLVDVAPSVQQAVEKQLEGTGIEIKIICHDEAYWKDISTWEERKAKVEELLTLYQNAKCVITRRLHCMLPCLALQTPVLCVIGYKDITRFRPYDNWVEVITPKEYIDGKFNFNILDPKPNSTEYIKYRKQLINSVNEFVAQMKDENGPVAQYVKTTYTPLEVIQWRHDIMYKTLSDWLKESRVMYRTVDQQEALIKKYKLQVTGAIDANDSLTLLRETLVLQNRVAELSKLLNRRSVRLVLKITRILKLKKRK